MFKFGWIGLCVIATVFSPAVLAHIALWDEAMYGWDAADVNQNEPVTPLADLPFSSWWFHGYLNRPPAPGKMMNLPAGGTYHGQVACNKALTTYGVVPSQQTGIYACEGDDPKIGGIGAMHTDDKWNTPVNQLKDVKGCGLSIAYKSDANDLVPEDFTVISTNYTCPWFKHVDFQIPADLPPCPPGGCHCMWGWVHSVLAGSEQMYQLNYRCNVTGATGTRAIPPPKTANKCHYPQDISNCTVGAKQPHYWLQLERNNNPQAYMDPPFYNGDHGFLNGAQTDLWAGQISNARIGTPSNSAIASSSSTSIKTSSPTVTTTRTQTALIGAPSGNSTTAKIPTSAGHCKRRRRAMRRGHGRRDDGLHTVLVEHTRDRAYRRMVTQVPTA